LDEVRAQSLENNRFRHAVGDIGKESMVDDEPTKHIFPDVKVPHTTLNRVSKGNAANPAEDLPPQWTDRRAEASEKRPRLALRRFRDRHPCRVPHCASNAFGISLAVHQL